MKNPLQSVDFKGVAVEHGEKIALGTVGLMVVLVLALGTRWSGTDKNPHELQARVETAQQAIVGSEWPEEQRKELAATMQGPAHPEARIERFIAERDPTDGEFAFDKAFPPTWPVGGEPTIVQEPQWLALREPVADAGTIVLDVPADPTATEEGVDRLAEEGAEEEEKPRRNPFVRRNGGGDVAAGMGFQVNAPGMSPEDEEFEDAAFPGAEDGMMEVGADTTAPSGFATPYVAVRMVFPFKEQLKEILKARNEQLGPQSEQLLQLHDFEIQRQRTKAGTDEWSDWEEFDLTQTLKLLNVVSGIESDIVAQKVIDSAVTMPLPIPKYGYWGDNGEHAIHPLVEEYRLSNRDRELTQIATEALVETQSRFGGRFDGPGFGGPPGFGGGPGFEGDGLGNAGLRPGGWAGLMQDSRELYRRVNSDDEMAKEYRTGLQKRLGERFGDRMRGAVMPELDTNYGEYVLFRFVDFDVHPNRKYRYRAKLTVLNPNYGLPLDRVAHPSVPEGALRETDWSEPTEPVEIEEDVEYFVVGTEERPPGVVVNVHQWSPETGTWVDGTRKVETGERVGGTSPTKTEVVDLINDSFEEDGEFAFETRDVLVDVVELPDIDFRDETHRSNLKLPKGISIQPETPAIVADQFGDLAELDPLATERERQAAARRIAAIKEGFAYLKQAQQQATYEGDALDAGLDEFGDPTGANANPEEARGKNRRFYRNALRRQSAEYGGEGDMEYEE